MVTLKSMLFFCIEFQNKLRMCQNIVPAFQMRDYQESVTTGQTHRVASV